MKRSISDLDRLVEPSHHEIRSNRIGKIIKSAHGLADYICVEGVPVAASVPDGRCRGGDLEWSTLDHAPLAARTCPARPVDGGHPDYDQRHIAERRFSRQNHTTVAMLTTLHNSLLPSSMGTSGL